MKNIAFAPYVEMDKELVKLFKVSSDECGFSNIIMDSGAGHDTAHLSRVAPASMIFIPCKDGLSHCPEEFTKSINIKKGSEVILKSILDLKDNYNEKI